MAEEKFLVVRLGSLGDIVHTLPAAAALRESFPNKKMVWLTHGRWRSLVEAANLTDEIWELDTRSPGSIRTVRKRIRREGFSVAIDYQGLWKSASLPFLAGVPRRIGFSLKDAREFGVSFLYTDKVNVSGVHVAEKNGELSLRAGARKPLGEFSLTVPEKSQQAASSMLRSKGIKEYVVLSPGGGWISKCWPAERFGQLALRLEQEFGMKSVINCGPGEEALAERVVAAAGDAKPISHSGEIGDMMALLKGARCVVAGDTGPLHLADALGTKVVAIFGPTDPARNGPFLARKTVLRAKNVESTYKRRDSPHPSLLEISVGDVVDAMAEAGVLR
ncbi:MAG: glycosyltransferase family 9 protein [Acidobacteria bacterium]|nr:glycosyltransferase family 9 protein [Acidobacteriota bacterium]MBS1867329.1 glycosyltransferase family 9 protein [Acidobacteriota bacterium]